MAQDTLAGLLRKLLHTQRQTVDIREAILTKGVPVPPGTALREYPAKILLINSPGAGTLPRAVFYDGLGALGDGLGAGLIEPGLGEGAEALGALGDLGLAAPADNLRGDAADALGCLSDLATADLVDPAE
jgi:hypothetical protein